MDLSVVIASFNSWQCLPHCLRSIQSHAGPICYEVVVVDNASSDGSAHNLASLFPNVRCLKNRQNIGFSRACNQGIKASSGEFILLLNPDCYLVSGTLAGAVAYLRAREEIGVLGGKVLNEDGTLQLACRRSIPTLRSAFFRFAGLSRLFPRSRALAAYNVTYADENQITDVEAVSGAFLMIRRGLVERIGSLDERFFMFGEDLDICLRAARDGKRVVYWPGVVVKHLKGQSIRSRPYASLYHFYNAMWLFYQKHYYRESTWWENCATFAGIWTVGLARLAWSGLTGPLSPSKRSGPEQGDRLTADRADR